MEIPEMEQKNENKFLVLKIFAFESRMEDFWESPTGNLSSGSCDH